jgi:hypothetical protein
LRARGLDPRHLRGDVQIGWIEMLVRNDRHAAGPLAEHAIDVAVGVLPRGIGRRDKRDLLPTVKTEEFL